MTTIGDKTRTIFLNHESHKLHLEFVAAAAIKKGQPVKLTSAGKVTPMLLADAGAIDEIGYATMNANTDDNVTVMVRGMAVIYSYSKGAVSPGHGKYDSFYTNAPTGEYYNVVDNSTFSTRQGWILDTATVANTLVRFLVKD